MSENITPWQQPEWLEAARSWIRAQMLNIDGGTAVEIEQIHVRPWSTVLRVTNNRHIFYFKASADLFGHETALTAYLAQNFPQITPDVVASDPERHWLLMHESGIALRDRIRSEKSIEGWRGVLPMYVDLQKSLSTRTDEILQLGVPDRRLEHLPGMFKGLLQDESALLLDQPDSLTGEEFARLKSCGPRFEQMCEDLAGWAIPASLHHDDFHDGNIFQQDGRTIFTDWGESAVTHPFFSLVVMLRSVENSLNLGPEAAEIQILRDWYLALWGEYGSLVELQPVVKLAESIGYINRALTWQMVISQLPEDLKPEYAIAVPAYLKDFINSGEAD
ncbi:MAG TPA: phosphotransferase [Anaerolineales bacterium]|jgi:hypothetical protein